MEIKNLKYKSLNGISERQLSEHYDVLYAGYVKKVGEIREKLGNISKENVNPTYSDYRELKLEETFSLNGVKLHELYFENLGGDGEVSGGILTKIEQDFGSFENWHEDFMAAGMGARGWVVLALDPIDGQLRNFLSDFHSHGCVWGTKPILVLDVYEHAYFIDYGTNRKGYLEAFMKNIDWGVVENRFSNSRNN